MKYTSKDTSWVHVIDNAVLDFNTLVRSPNILYLAIIGLVIFSVLTYAILKNTIAATYEQNYGGMGVWKYLVVFIVVILMNTLSMYEVLDVISKTPDFTWKALSLVSHSIHVRTNLILGSSIIGIFFA